MADGSLTYNIGGQLLNNGETVVFLTSQITLAVGQEFTHQSYLALSAGEAALGLGGVANPSAIWIRNLDDTNFVDILSGTGGSVAVRVFPATTCFVGWVAAVAPYILANTANVLVDYIVFDTIA